MLEVGYAAWWVLRSGLSRPVSTCRVGLCDSELPWAATQLGERCTLGILERERILVVAARRRYAPLGVFHISTLNYHVSEAMTKRKYSRIFIQTCSDHLGGLVQILTGKHVCLLTLLLWICTPSKRRINNWSRTLIGQWKANPTQKRLVSSCFGSLTTI